MLLSRIETGPVGKEKFGKEEKQDLVIKILGRTMAIFIHFARINNLTRLILTLERIFKAKYWPQMESLS